MVRENSIIAIGSFEDGPEYDYTDGVELRVYELEENGDANSTIYQIDSSIELSIHGSRNKNNITLSVTAKTEKPYTIKLINQTATQVTDCEFRIDENHTLIQTTGSRTIQVTL